MYPKVKQERKKTEIIMFTGKQTRQINTGAADKIKSILCVRL